MRFHYENNIDSISNLIKLKYLIKHSLIQFIIKTQRHHLEFIISNTCLDQYKLKSFSEINREQFKMILQQLRIFLQILCVPVILSQSYHGFECRDTGYSYHCFNMNLADVASNFDTWNKVHKMLAFIIGIFSIEFCQLKGFNFENFNYFYHVFIFLFLFSSPKFRTE